MGCVELLLASTSPARRALLTGLGLPFRAVAPDVDEDVGPLPPGEVPLVLAERKARAVFAQNPTSLVIGADQVAVVDGKVLGKPPDRSRAREQLSLLLGRTHDIVTAVCLVGPNCFRRASETSRLRFYALSEAELERYLDCGEWEGCAGGYRIEGKGQLLIEAVEGDRTNVQGLPLTLLVRLLREVGFPLF